MPDICTQISDASKARVKELIAKARETQENQNALVEEGKIVSVVSGGRPAHRIAGDGKGIVYVPAPKMKLSERTTRTARLTGMVLQHSRPSSLDLVEMVEHDRPFTCRAQKFSGASQAGMAGKTSGTEGRGINTLACYTPDEDSYKMAEKFIDAVNESREDWKESLKYWEKHGEPAVEHEGNLFETAMRREIYWRSRRAEGVLAELAPEALNTCKVKL